MDIPYLLAHPEELDQETLYDLRRLVGVHPTFHAARILFLQNLFLLHDPTFDQELRRAALLVPDRRVLCNITQFGGLQPMLDRARRQLRKEAEDTPSIPADDSETPPTTAPTHDSTATTTAGDDTDAATLTTAAAPTTTNGKTDAQAATPATDRHRRPKKKYRAGDTTSRLLDSFLDSTPAPLQRRRIKADPATDYMAYILQQDETGGDDLATSTTPLTADEQPAAAATQATTSDALGSKRQLHQQDRMDELISGFIASYENGIQLPEDPATPDGIIPEPDAPGEEIAPSPATTTAAAHEAESETETETATLTETLATIYIKQQKYDRAIEVINKLHAAPGRAPSPGGAGANPYYADQVRFLQKLAIINRHKR